MADHGAAAVAERSHAPMIAFGCVVSEAEPYRRYAEPGIDLVREPDSRVYPFAAVGRLGRSYNLLLESAARCPDLEALVIVHPYAQIDDPAFMAKARAGLADPQVGLLGCAGATGVRDLAWWKGEVSCGQVMLRYTELGGGELPAYGWAAPRPAPAPVEGVDGFLLVLSPWAVRNVRFDEGLPFPYGVELDYCVALRAAGRALATLDARVIEHRSLELISDMDMWVESHIALARKWEGRMPGASADPDWERRARRAEAEREAMRAVAYAWRLEYDARVDALQCRLDQTTATRSWRMTAPLRELNRWRRERRGGSAPGPAGSGTRSAAASGTRSAAPTSRPAGAQSRSARRI